MPDDARGAERQEISMKTEVVEGLEVFRPVRAHDRGQAKVEPVRLKPDTTSDLDGPAEGGRYVRGMTLSVSRIDDGSGGAAGGSAPGGRSVSPGRIAIVIFVPRGRSIGSVNQ